MIGLDQASMTRLRASRRMLSSSSCHRMRLWHPISIYQLRFLKALVRAVPPCVMSRTTKGRINGWSQMDEDWTFGLNGYERVWRGPAPTLEEQRVLMPIYRKVTAAAVATILDAPKVPPATPESILSAVDAHLQEADEAGYFTGAPIDGMVVRVIK